MSREAGTRKCSKCGIVGEHGERQTYCKACHRMIVRERVARLPLVRMCSGCGVVGEHSAGNSKCKKCKAAASRLKHRAMKIVKEAFSTREGD